MDQNSTNSVHEFDLKDLFLFVIGARKWLIFGASIGLILSILIYLLSPKEYTSTIKLLPSNSSSSSSSSSLLKQFSGLAGVSLGESSSGIASYQYSTIISSKSFRLSLVKNKYHLIKDSSRVVLQEYLYSELVESPINLTLDFIKSYTIGLPGTIKYWLSPPEFKEIYYDEGVIQLDIIELAVLAELNELINLEIDANGFVLITVSMPDPILAAELSNNVYLLLTKEVRELYLKDQEKQIDFLIGKKNVAYNELISAERELNNWKDSNSNLVTEKVRSIERQLTAKYNLAYDIYSTVSTELESAKIKLNENLPVMTVIDEPLIINKATYPRLLFFLVAGVFIGCFFGFAGYFILRMVHNFKKGLNE
ncbi:MAG: Wzz/FepE/Etk N-terminal domain-containing protein [Cyclobacteriaceae bacterium]